MEIAALITAFVTLFVVIDPIGLAPMFVAITKGEDSGHRRMVALRSCAIAAILLTLFGLFGESVLGFVGISMPAFRISGGILLFLTALEMLFEKRTQRRRGQATKADDPSVFPLATPLIAGPGAIATMILLTGQADGISELIAVHLMMLAVVALVLLFFLAAPLMERALGDTGINVVSRLLGMLLAALSVQFVLDGLAGFGLSATTG
ncbi:MAG: MarC family protein [Marinosulfonomonas sp.]|nr:MarC family protein [Marinosulfonomonas sp.]